MSAKMQSKPSIQQIIEFLKNPTFGAFVEDTKLRVKDYERQLRRKDAKMNKIQYNEYDIIRENIITLENFVKLPATILGQIRAESPPEAQGRIQDAINYSLGMAGEEVLHATETKVDDAEEKKKQYFNEMQAEIDRLQREQLEK